LNDFKRRIQKIKDEVSIETVIEKIGGQVSWSGYSDWKKVLCPFHDDRVPSAAANPIAGAFICHACGVKGDVIAIAQEHLIRQRTESAPEVTFSSVLDWLEEEFNLQ